MVAELVLSWFAPTQPPNVQLRRCLCAAWRRLATGALLPHLREMIVVGLLEAQLRQINSIRSRSFLCAENDGFDNEIRAFSRSSMAGASRLGARAALPQRQVQGEYLLTLAYDSEKSITKTRLFQDADPTAFYPGNMVTPGVRGIDA